MRLHLHEILSEQMIHVHKHCDQIMRMFRFLRNFTDNTYGHMYDATVPKAAIFLHFFREILAEV